MVSNASQKTNVKTYFHRRRNHIRWQADTADDGQTCASSSQSGPELSHPGEPTRTAERQPDVHTLSPFAAQSTHTRLTALCPGLPRWTGTRKVKPIWILLKQETVSGSGISWVICKSAPHSRQITMAAPHHSVFYWPDALPATQPTASKHWRQHKVYMYISKRPISYPVDASRYLARPATKRFQTSDWRALEVCCRPWTWWCNDATALAGYATLTILLICQV